MTCLSCGEQEGLLRRPRTLGMYRWGGRCGGAYWREGDNETLLSREIVYRNKLLHLSSTS